MKEGLTWLAVILISFGIVVLFAFSMEDAVRAEQAQKDRRLKQDQLLTEVLKDLTAKCTSMGGVLLKTEEGLHQGY